MTDALPVVFMIVGILTVLGWAYLHYLQNERHRANEARLDELQARVATCERRLAIIERRSIENEQVMASFKAFIQRGAEVFGKEE